MIPSGFILLHRKITEWEWYQNPNTFRVFLHCLLMANFTEGRFEGKNIQRGQFVTSLQSLSDQTSLSIRQVRVALDHLIMTGELTSKAFSKFRIITVVNYDKYQCNDKQDDKQMTDKRQANDKQMTSKRQQYKKNNNNNNVTNYEEDVDNNIFTLSDREVSQRIKEDQEIESAALNVGLMVSPSAMEKARDFVFRYGLQNVLDAINASVDVPKWSYVEGILRKNKQEARDAEREAEQNLHEHNEQIKLYLINHGRWDEEYQCEKDKADKYRQKGFTPEEAQQDMLRIRESRIRQHERFMKGTEGA